MIQLTTPGFLPVLLFFLCQEMTSQTQEATLLRGRISADTASVENIHIINLELDQGTTSDENGMFRIFTNQGDRLLFSSIHYKNLEIIVSEEILKNGFINVELTAEANELDQVNLSNLKLSGYLGNDLNKIKIFDRDKYHIPHPEKQITLNERRLYTASEGITNRWNYIGVLFGSVSLDVVLNDINGRTEYLRAVIEQDKIQLRVQEGIDIFGREFFVNELDLPISEIENFVYFCAEDESFKNKLQSNNRLELLEFYQLKIEKFKNLRELYEKD